MESDVFKILMFFPLFNSYHCSLIRPKYFLSSYLITEIVDRYSPVTNKVASILLT